MKILHIIPYFAPRFGGDVAVAFSLTRQLSCMGHECTLITSDYLFDREYAASLESSGVKVTPLHCSANFAMFFYTPAIRDWLNTHIDEFSIIHAHDYRTYQNNVLSVISRKHNVPYILQPHGSTPRVVSRKALKWLYDVVYGYRVLRNADHIIAVSKEEAGFDRQLSNGQTDISVIYNGMEPASYLNHNTDSSFKSALGISGKMILYLGRLNQTKGIDFALRAFALMVERMDDVIFVIAGPDDGYEVTLRALCEKLKITDNVLFTGEVKESEKVAAFADADVFLHTVRYMGGVGLAPLEAVLSGTPVIVTDECGEVVKEADCGYIVEYGDTSDLVTKMKNLLDDPGIGREMVEKGQQYISQNLTWEKVALKVERLYREILDKKGKNKQDRTC